MSKHYTVSLIEEGRSGTVRYSEGASRSHDFFWEFGGGDALVLISIPSPAEWPAALPWAADRRAEVLDRVAAEVCRQRSPGSQVVRDEHWLTILEPGVAPP